MAGSSHGLGPSSTGAAPATFRRASTSSDDRRWVVNHYYGVDQGRGWDLCDGRNRLSAPQRDPGVALREGQGKASPFDPNLRGYWEDRRTRRLEREASHFHSVHLLQRQGGR